MASRKTAKKQAKPAEVLSLAKFKEERGRAKREANPPPDPADFAKTFFWKRRTLINWVCGSQIRPRLQRRDLSLMETMDRLLNIIDPSG